MNRPFQRIGSQSNAHVGREFEDSARMFFETQGVSLHANLTVLVGVGSLKKNHSFDLGNSERKILVECKSHRWTSGDNVPSAKLTVWNEAMYYFTVSPPGYRCIMFLLRDYSSRRRETLAQYYIRTYAHLIPAGVEFWEYDEASKHAVQLYTQQGAASDRQKR